MLPVGRRRPWHVRTLVTLLIIVACASSAHAQDSFSSGDGGDTGSDGGAFSAGGGASSGGSSGPSASIDSDLPARSCWMILKQNPLPVAKKDFPRCFPASANLLTLCKTQPPESPSCIALIAQVPPPQTIVYNDTLPATKIINGVAYKKATFLTTQNGVRGYLEGYFNPRTPYYNGSIDLEKGYGKTAVTLDLNKSQDMTRNMGGLRGTIALNTDANNLITSVTLSLTNVVDFQYQPAVLTMTPSNKRLVSVSK